MTEQPIDVEYLDASGKRHELEVREVWRDRLRKRLIVQVYWRDSKCSNCIDLQASLQKAEAEREEAKEEARDVYTDLVAWKERAESAEASLQQILALVEKWRAQAEWAIGGDELRQCANRPTAAGKGSRSS